MYGLLAYMFIIYKKINLHIKKVLLVFIVKNI